MANATPRQWRVVLGIGGGAVLLAVAGGIFYQANTADAGPQDPTSLLECAEGSDYVVGAAPLYVAGVKTDRSPGEIAERYAAEHALSRRAGNAELSRHAVYESSDRVDIAFSTSDGRTIAVVSAEESNGWKQAGSVECAEW